MADNWDKWIVNGSVSQFWKHFGFNNIPIDEDEDDQATGIEKQEATKENQSSSKSVQPRFNPINSQDGRIQRKTYQTKNKFIK